ncbi:hypothetical protein ACWG8W_06545 [Citricoccus zhacaiensis]
MSHFLVFLFQHPVVFIGGLVLAACVFLNGNGVDLGGFAMSDLSGLNPSENLSEVFSESNKADGRAMMNGDVFSVVSN